MRVIAWIKDAGLWIGGKIKSLKPLGIPVLVVTLVAIIWFVPIIQLEQWQAQATNNSITAEQIANIENEARKTLSTIIGGLFAVVALSLGWRRVAIADETRVLTEESQITDRYTKAVEQLGHEKLEVRLGGIYALERIAKDSQKDHWTIMEVLTAYVRKNAPILPGEEIESDESVETSNGDKSESSSDREINHVEEGTDERIAIQAIITIIGNRKWRDDEPGMLNLQRVNIQGMNMANLSLEKINFLGEKLNMADLRGANFRQSNLWTRVSESMFPTSFSRYSLIRNSVP